MDGATHFYVWYTVRGDLATAVARVSAMMTALESRTGVAGRVLARQDDPSTWMEIYENVSDASRFPRLLDDLARAHELVACIEDGKRHVERFVSLTDALG